jgi:hypothetical protein
MALERINGQPIHIQANDIGYTTRRKTPIF